VLRYAAHMTTTLDAPIASYGGSRPNALRLVAAGLTDIWSRRRLARYLVSADMTKKGSDTILGNVWWILDPLLQLAVYVVFVTLIGGGRQPDYPLFVFCAVLPWKWFSSAITDAITSVVSRERIIKQVHFPKIVLPVSATVSGIVNFAFGLIPLAALMLLFYRDRLSWTILLIPLVAVVQLVLTMGISILVAAINVFYRDVGNVARHVLRLWFYLSPALYSTAQVDALAARHPEARLVFGLNPFTVLFESYRAVIYDDTPPPWLGLAVLLVVSVVILALCTYVFKRMEPSFAKVL
jgi:ABC-type polysaccharide/polyol phosphate export permease